MQVFLIVYANCAFRRGCIFIRLPDSFRRCRTAPCIACCRRWEKPPPLLKTLPYFR